MPNVGRNDDRGTDLGDGQAHRHDRIKWQPILPLMAAILGRSEHHLPRPTADRARESVEIVVYGPDGRAVSDAEVTFTCSNAPDAEVALTDRFGKAVLSIPVSQTPKGSQLLIEAKGFWGRRIHNPILHPIAPESPMSNAVILSLIEGPAVDSLPWGIEAMRFDAVSALSFLGARAAKCALIVGEVGGHGCGQPVRCASGSAAACDRLVRTEKAHLSGGTLAMTSLLHHSAPDAEVTVLPLSLDPSSRDIVAAIDWCIAHAIDVACLCFSSDGRDWNLQNALQRAQNAGLLVICPAGDMRARIAFPAASGQVLTVAPIGHGAVCPKESAHGALNGVPGLDGYCLSNLAVEGPGIDMVAPGISILAEDQILSGSAFAAVHVAAFALCLLQSDESMHRAPRSAVRLLELGASLRACCMDLGFAPRQQGAGMPVWGVKGRARKSPEVEAQLAKGAQTAMDLIAQGLS